MPCREYSRQGIYEDVVSFDFVMERALLRRTRERGAIVQGHTRMNRTSRLGIALLVASAALTVGGCKDTVAALTSAVSPPEPAAPIVPGQIGGRWGTHWGSEVCNLTLTQNATNVTGSYTSTGAPPGTVAGTFVSNVLTGTWTDQQGAHGGIVLTFSPDSRSFTGTWGSGESTSNGGQWTGRR
jgi:hypothetical protein